MRDNQLTYPIVLKPDFGLAGIGVSLLSCEKDMETAISTLHDDYLVQEYLSRPKELSVFYIKDPKEPIGKIWSITERIVVKKQKTLPKMIIP